MNKDIVDQVNKYYTDKIIVHGATPKGVDWNGIESQEMRFEQLLKVIKTNQTETYSILDYGCGYGSLLGYLSKKNILVEYIGFDISVEMLKKANELYSNEHSWINEIPKDYQVDYVMASGLFNVKQQQTLESWQDYVYETIHQINKISRCGFALNMLTSYSDAEFMKDYLYYPEPEKIFNFCKKNFSKQVALLHDYQLYEFTILVKK